MKPRLLVLQASSLCNLDCTYCYVPNRLDGSRMSEATLRAALRLLLSECGPGDSVRILWHAGEPLAVGLEYFERATTILRECNPRGIKLSQSVQTNGTLIDDRWCRLFVREKIVVGLSVDGPAAVHDRHRRTRGDTPTHAAVMRGAHLLKEHAIPLHAIAVLTPHSLSSADEIFDFFAGEGFASVGFNVEETEGVHASAFGDRPESDPYYERYATFMARLFDRWQTAGRRPSIREFESMGLAIGAFLRDHDYRRTADDSIPFRNITVSREGEISTFSPELASGTPTDGLRFSIGNVHRTRFFDELVANAKFQDLAREIGRGVDRCRSECEYFPICGGGSPSNKFYEHGTFDCTETMTCALHRKTLAHVVADGLRNVSRLGQAPAHP